jgi:hypothetical protein
VTLPISEFAFATLVRILRAGGMEDRFIARQIVDDWFRAGHDWRFRQHLVEQKVSEVKP